MARIKRGCGIYMKKKLRLDFENILFQVVITLVILTVIILLTVATISKMGQSVLIMAELKNKCISECVAFNKEAILKGIAQRCAC